MTIPNGPLGGQIDTFRCIEMAIFPASALTGSFQPMNSATYQTGTNANGFQYDILILWFYNDSDFGVTISYDGIINNEYLPSKSTKIIDLQTNHRCNSGYSSGAKIGRQGQLIYGKGTAGSDGLDIYIGGYF